MLLMPPIDPLPRAWHALPIVPVPIPLIVLTLAALAAVLVLTWAAGPGMAARWRSPTARSDARPPAHRLRGTRAA